MISSIDNDPYDPSDDEIAELNRVINGLSRLKAECDAKAELRRQNKGLAKAKAGMWRDNPKGTAHWKAAIAGLAEAYADITGKRGDARDQIAQAAGISNVAVGQSTATRTPNAIGAIAAKRPFSPGDSGKSVRDFIKATKNSKDPSVLRTYRNARRGKLIFNLPQTHVGPDGPLGRDDWILRPNKWLPQPRELPLAAVIAKAKKTKLKHEQNVACSIILAAAKAYGEGRWVYHGKRKPRSIS